MPRTFEISYTKDGKRKTFIEQVDHFYENDEWRLVAQRFHIPIRDQHREDKAPQTHKTMCIAAGYTDVAFIEQP
ncbi:hypothetical protein C1Y08_28660 [Pseudomonas sp. FW306-02-F02-AA]|uniref:Uncharacterized protein n=1 Tax=Pseudomonas fluorescens TaxID=294 RepID=A0A0N9VZZ8_PSEFL|nr:MULTISPECIES: hypothetical protein [Pseudomonas]ALI04560.1 hypothetical protein AO353_27190 [Pseudomonas fluorescens]PMZ02375.1 hypothetical protein C1Y07_20595 [Pseudomonas sp. FW306-02-F02-AB]PMZ06589.1 hypothetical protein C1Y06_28895 [Pseudomonas sp. FW306-02-H06C]PMZ12543.1 hypothetical protein C1Y08_28660 [Pseudomonas sp. FW306-02-F02-AA]PMZ18545.1 hypothetical protein C1Y09_28860 [Pseudomonas sp. FW306-02-F08-AA]